MRIASKKFRWAIATCLVISSGINCDAQLLKDIAQPGTIPANAPKYSDVVMRSLSFRDESFEHGSTMQNALDFHVTRLDWVYIREEDGGYMKDFAAKGIKVGGTINSSPGDSTVSVKNINGKALEVPWLPGYYFICVNNPGAFKYNMDNTKIGVDLGCVAIQRDDPGSGNVNYTKTCCFCSFCKEKALSQGINLNDDAQRKTFNKASTMEFYEKLYRLADSYAGFDLAHSCNGLDRSWDNDKLKDIFNVHDYRNGEIMKPRPPGELYHLSQETRLRNKAQLFQYTVKGEMDEILQRKYIALGYATGMNVMVPWDVYINRAPRYFGVKEDFVDLFGFVRCLGEAGYLDGYQDAAIGGYDMDENRYATDPVGIVSGNTELSMFARAKPGDADAPVIVHLLNWGEGGSAKLKLLTASFFNGKSLNIKLWTPKPYISSEHVDAENSGNYESLKWDRTGDISVTVNGSWTEVNVPDLSPWGILVVEKDGAGTKSENGRSDIKTLFSRDELIEMGYPFGKYGKDVPLGDPDLEWQRSNPDISVFIPLGSGFYDGDNEHFLVFESPGKDELLAMWTQSSREAHGDNHLVLARSKDGEHWSNPTYIVGAKYAEGGLQASWGFPIVSDNGRIYLFYTKEIELNDNDRQGSGTMGCIYSDDNGYSWTQPKEIPMPRSKYDNPDPRIPKGWIVFQKPILDQEGKWLAGYTLITSPAIMKKEKNWPNADSRCYFMRFMNIDANPDPEDIEIEWYPENDLGLEVTNIAYPHLSTAQEPAVVLLPDGRLFTVMRTMTGYIYYSVSADNGKTWDKPEILKYEDSGMGIKHPMSPCPLYKLKNGKFVLIFHNNEGTRFGYNQTDKVWSINVANVIRNPTYYSFGEFKKDAKQPIWFSEPVEILNSGDVALPPKMTAEIGTYPSITEFKGKSILWYPDRKRFLLGKYLETE